MVCRLMMVFRCASISSTYPCLSVSPLVTLSASPRWTWTWPELPQPGSVRYTSATVRLILESDQFCIDFMVNVWNEQQGEIFGRRLKIAGLQNRNGSDQLCMKRQLFRPVVHCWHWNCLKLRLFAVLGCEMFAPALCSTLWSYDWFEGFDHQM